MADAKKVNFDELLEQNAELAKRTAAGDTVKGVVTSVKKHEILIDLGIQGTGLVSRKEAGFARNLHVGDEVTASVVDTECSRLHIGVTLPY